MHQRVRIATVLLTGILSSTSFLFGQTKMVPSQTNILKRIASQPYVLMNANNVTCWVRSDGYFPPLVNGNWNGEFPKHSGVGAVYQEGIVFGGKVHDGLYTDSIRVTGDTYFTGMQPGAIRLDGAGNSIGADDPNDPSVRAFAIRPDMPASIQDDTTKWPDLKEDAASFFQKSKDSVSSQDINQIAIQYFKDWNEWPAAKGAAWFVDTIGIVRTDAAYDPNNPHDIPGIPDAAKTIWFVCNDLSALTTAQFAGSPPMGMEEQVTLWAFHNLPDPLESLENVIYKQVKLIYKGNPGAVGNARIDSMYICQWVDGDLGDGTDDYGGCDSALNLGFEYNSSAIDKVYEGVGLNPPALGYVFLQGTSSYTGNQSDSAIIDCQWRKGYRSNYGTPMTSFFLHQTGTTNSDPDIGTYSGTLQWFNVFRGCMFRPQYPDGVPICSAYVYSTDHHIVTSYCFSGDPSTDEGWIDGLDLAAGERRFWAVHGPITVQLHDTAEVALAEVAAIGANNIWSLLVLKNEVGSAKFYFNALAISSSITTTVAAISTPRSFELAQNYPNPFNPTTTIRYEIPISCRVSVKVFNILGQEIATLVNEQEQAGRYSLEWNASSEASGVYFCRFEATPISGTNASFRGIKKLVLLR